MVDERLEFEISQLADGTLPAGRVTALRAQIANDPAATALLSSYGNLHAGLSALPPLPAIDWQRLSSHIAAHIENAEPLEQSSYPMPWVRRAIGVAVAACILIVATVSLRSHSPKLIAVSSTLPRGMIAVAGPAIESPAGTVVQEIAIGPSAAVAGMEDNLQYGDAGVVAQSQRVIIASAADAAQDTQQDSTASPY